MTDKTALSRGALPAGLGTAGLAAAAAPALVHLLPPPPARNVRTDTGPSP